MSINKRDLRKAFYNRFLQIASGLGISQFREGVNEVIPPFANALRETMLFGDDNPIGYASNVTQRMDGIYQIDVMAPFNTNIDDLLDLATQVEQGFTRGEVLTENNTKAKVIVTRISPKIETDTHNFYAVRVTFTTLS